MSDWLDAVKWDAQGLVPAIAQDAAPIKLLGIDPVPQLSDRNGAVASQVSI